MKIRRSLLKSTVSVQTYSGEGAYGPVYASAVSVSVNVDATRRLVRDSAGDEVVSELTLHVHPDDESKFTPESLVTVSSRTSRVLAASPQCFRNSTVFIKVVCA